MTSLIRLTITLIGVLQFIHENVAQDCNVDGTSSSYSETFLGTMHHGYNSQTILRRYIQASGCPNHDYATLNPNIGEVQSFAYSIPAYPYFNGESYQDALDNNFADLSRQGGDVGLTLNGVSIYTAYAGNYDYDGDGDIDDDDADAYGETSNAVTAEGDTFDRCGGHSSGANAGYQYHYHVPPTCLIAQMGGLDTTQHSPQIGWMYDGFPIYGNRGPSGTMMKRCGQVGAHETICLDKCNGYYSDDGSIDVYKYRYYITGELSDQTTIPTSPLPTSSPANESYFPFTPYCSLGCLSQGSRANWEGSTASYLSICNQAITNEAGVIFNYDLSNSTESTLGGLHEGVTEPYDDGDTDDDDTSSSSSSSSRPPNVVMYAFLVTNSHLSHQ